MPKNNEVASPSVIESPSPLTESLGPPTANQIATNPIPKDLQDLLEYLEGYYGDDEGRFDATYLWPWRNLPSKRRNLNERILRVILKRLLAPKASLEQHWRRLHEDIREHRRRRKASGKLASADAAEMVLNAVVDALLPVREASAKELGAIMRNASRVAAELTACLELLRNIGLNIEELLPTEETIRHADEENGGRKYGGAYASARFFIYMKLPRPLPHEQREEITDYALRVAMADPSVAVGILERIAQRTQGFKFKRHNVSGRQRFAYVMATHMVRDSMKFFGAPRYERAEAFTKAASGVQIKGLRQMMERERKVPATERAKRPRAPRRGN